MGVGSKTNGLPAWQRASPSPPVSSDTTAPNSSEINLPSESSSEQAPPPTESDKNTEGQAKPDLVEQGRRFLQDESVKAAPLAPKKAFLESRGLSKSEIDKAIFLAAETPPGPPSQTLQTPLESSQTIRDPAPPIITYPEFLMHAQKPPPIITARRLMNTAYIASAVGTAFYMCSKYIINPMTASLTEARHEYATHAQAKLEELNIILEENVSEDSKNSLLTTKLQQGDDLDDTASETSDPTELFHRDCGTQTTPSLLIDDKSTDSSSNASENEKLTIPERQTIKVEDLTAHVKALTNDDLIVSSEDQETLTVLRVLHEYLDSLAYPTYSTIGGYGNLGSGSGYGFGKDGKKEDDELSKFKSEIRSVKGTLLSARNFPSSAGRRAVPSPSSNLSRATTSGA